ncbi:rhomboid family intramembrane serine protease [Mucilaginibacter lacusdianchii]|uniref:rhomboid family intramembrane serine protease n=1 Tax=Mucilaginibacter lacusdianchii TaxID=2684211 RepID=UPI001E31FB6C|nr:rhomboid family intramembrane serine protease [Mucilaginibacter sp. JXJ CY 39]
MIVNVLFYVAIFVFRGIGKDITVWLAAFYPNSPLFHPWQIVSYLFIHDPRNWGHIFGNMLGLLFIGPILEQTFGPKRFLTYYFITGIGALLLQYIVQGIMLHQATGSFFINVNTFQIQGQGQMAAIEQVFVERIMGASGAIFGLIIAIYLFYPELEFIVFPIPIPLKVKYVVPFYVLYELYNGFRPSQGDTVAHFAHIGGALFGFLLIKFWGYKKPNNFY